MKRVNLSSITKVTDIQQKKKNKGDRDIRGERKVKVPRIVRKLELCKKALHTY